jgi:hypothetical protein
MSLSAEVSDCTAHGRPHRGTAGRAAAASILAGMIALSYVVVSLQMNGGTLFKASSVDYYTKLLGSIRHGHLWIPNDTSYFDLVEFQGRAYLYWGLSPLLLIAPFYSLGHGFQFDVAYTLVLGLANVAAFSWMIREAARALGLTVATPVLACMVLLFAFASPNYYLSVQGRIWHTNQVAATFYCLLSLGFTFRFIARRDARRWFWDVALAAVCFSLAWDARMTFLAIGPLLGYAVFSAWRGDRPVGVKASALVAGVTLVMIVSWASYNYIRFASLTETGYTFMHHAPRFQESVRTGALWSLKYLGHNWHYYVRHAPFDPTRLRLRFDPEGNSILCLYPWTLLVLAIPFVWRRVARSSKPLLAVAIGVASVQFAAELTFYSTGWAQLGARYFLDSVPVLFVLLLPVFQRTSIFVLGAGVVIGGVLNTLGMSRFYGAPLF